MSDIRVLVVSIDAMTGEDLHAACRYPHFAQLLAQCALATNVEAVFPSLTYPCHVAMATGCWPMHNGVINNEIFLKNTLKRPWVYYTDQIHRPTIFKAARESGVSTGCVMWPCMGKGPIDTLVPEIWGDTPDASFLEPFCEAGSETFIREVWPQVGNIPRGFQQPMFDRFVTKITCEVIRRKKPRLLYCHICQVDNAKHYAGLHTPEVECALKNTDLLLGQLMNALKEAGVERDTQIVLCSDHGQTPVRQVSYPNRLLAQNGFLCAQGIDAISVSHAQAHSACLSAFLYAENPEYARKAMDCFLRADSMERLGISEMISAENARERFHVQGDFAAVLLGKEGVYFHNAVDPGPLSLPVEESGLHYRANHGHDPALGEKPFFLISGSRAAKDVRISHGVRLIDEPATIAHLMGFALGPIDGAPITQMLRESV